MKHLKKIALLSGLILFCTLTGAQEQQTLAEKLGYSRDAKLLIVHADDIGLAHSVNRASITAFEKQGITSGSIMVPCPWFPDFAEYFKKNPDLDVGIHLTLTAEWDYYKWGGVLPSSEISSLLDEHGYFYPTVEQVAMNADPDEVEKEIRAQVDRAIAFGIKPSHIDTHMGSVIATPEIFQKYLILGKEYGLPIFLPRALLQSLPPEMQVIIEKEHILVDGFFMMQEERPGITWSEAYRQMIEKIQPGLNQLIVHLAIDDEEMQAVAINHPAFGSAWREKDLDFVTSQEFKDMLEEYGIQLVTWKEIKNVFRY